MDLCRAKLLESERVKTLGLYTVHCTLYSDVVKLDRGGPWMGLSRFIQLCFFYENSHNVINREYSSKVFNVLGHRLNLTVSQYTMSMFKRVF